VSSSPEPLSDGRATAYLDRAGSVGLH